MQAFSKIALILLSLFLSLQVLAQKSKAGKTLLSANWNPGDQWAYTMNWTLGVSLRGKEENPASIDFFPRIEVLTKTDTSYLLQLQFDSVALRSGRKERDARVLLLFYKLKYKFETDQNGQFKSIINKDEIREQLNTLLAKNYSQSDAEKMFKELQKRNPNWINALFLRDFGFIFYAYGKPFPLDQTIERSEQTDKLYYGISAIPTYVGQHDSAIGTKTDIHEEFTFRKTGKPKILTLSRALRFTRPAASIYRENGDMKQQIDTLQGKISSTAHFDPSSGQFLKGRWEASTTGGGGKLVLKSGSEYDTPEQKYWERHSYKPFDLSTKKSSNGQSLIMGATLPEFPKFETVVSTFFKQYRQRHRPYFILEKRPEGYYIVRTTENRIPAQAPVLFWSSKKRSYLRIDAFKDPLPPKEEDRDRIEAVFFADEIKDNIRDYMYHFPAGRPEYDRQAFYGYKGWYLDVIDLLEPLYKELNDDQLHALARAYSTSAVSLISGYAGLADSAKMFVLPPGQNAMTRAQLKQYRLQKTKAIQAYKVLSQRNPAYITPVGPVYTKYSNEIMDGFLQLRFYQNEKEARKMLQAELYDAYLLESARNLLQSCPANAVLVTYGDTDTYPLLYVQAQEELRTDVLVANSSLLLLPRYFKHLTKGVAGAKPLTSALPKRFFDETVVIKFTPEGRGIKAKTSTPDAFFKALGQQKLSTTGNGTKLGIIPKTTIEIAPPKGPFSNSKADTLISWSPKGRVLDLRELAMLDIITSNSWQRPLCFTLTSSPKTYTNWQKHLVLDGLILKVVPEQLPRTNWNNMTIRTKKSTDIWLNKLQFKAREAITKSDRAPFFNTQLNAGLNLAKALSIQGDTSQALAIATIVDASFSDEFVARGPNWMDLVAVFSLCGQKETAERIGIQILENYQTARLSKWDMEQKHIALIQLQSLARKFDLKHLLARL